MKIRVDVEDGEKQFELNLPVVPRIGDGIEVKGRVYGVEAVTWTPDQAGIAAIVFVSEGD